MANVTFLKSFNMAEFSLGYDSARITNQTKNLVAVAFDGSNEKDLWQGRNFRYSGNINEGGRVTGGKVTGAVYQKGTTKIVQAKGLNANAKRVFNILNKDATQGGAAQELYGFLLRKNDVVKGSRSRDVILSYGGNDKVLGKGGDDLLGGGAGKDVLRGGAGDDILVGTVAASKLGEKDTLIGGRGADAYVLGEASIVGDLYNKNGNSDYAWIKGFNPNSGDTIAVSGNPATGYTLVQGVSVGNGRQGTGIYDSQGDLLALVQGASADQVSSQLVNVATLGL